MKKKYGYECIPIGDLLHRESRKNTKQGNLIKEVIMNGGLIDNAITFGIVESELKRLLKSAKGIIIDGVIQSKDHMERFDKLIRKYKIESDIVYIYLRTSPELAAERLKMRTICNDCGYVFSNEFVDNKACSMCDSSNYGRRIDDNDVTVKKRLDRFENETLELVLGMHNRDNFVIIDSDISIDLLHEKLDKYCCL